MRAVSEEKDRRAHVRRDTTRLVKETHQEARYLRSDCPRRPRTTSGGVEALVRALASHTQYIPDRLPRQANITCVHYSLIERTLGGTKTYLRDRNSRESGIVNRNHRIRTIPVISALDLVKHLFGGLHIHFLLKNFSRADIA